MMCTQRYTHHDGRYTLIYLITEIRVGGAERGSRVERYEHENRLNGVLSQTHINSCELCVYLEGIFGVLPNILYMFVGRCLPIV